MSHNSLLLRLRARLYKCCVSQATRSLHFTPPLLKVSGSQRKQFTEELTKQLRGDLLERKERGRMSFDRVSIGREDDVRRVKRTGTMRHNDAYSKQSGSQSAGVPSVQSDALPDELPSLRESLEQEQSHIDHVITDTAQDQSFTSVPRDTADQSDTPHNIMGDLDSLFSDATLPEPVVGEEAGIVESRGRNVDYNIYYTPAGGERYVMPERVLGKRDLNSAIPLDHVTQFLREYKCFDTEVIQARKGSFVEHVIITSLHNTKHLKDTARSFYKMCRDDYNIPMHSNSKSNAGQAWIAYDVGHTIIHFFLPVQRARVNLESYWLGQDTELEDDQTAEERYTADLLEGLFPDEDFSKLGKPFELVHDQKER